MFSSERFRVDGKPRDAIMSRCADSGNCLPFLAEAESTSLTLTAGGFHV
ncbi:MAG: hypothetical protein OJF51_000818 [Nitrospira sp.]|nr:MAG: hypothetical protein OJF51_000818 [Nitrospira sp.]